MCGCGQPGCKTCAKERRTGYLRTKDHARRQRLKLNLKEGENCAQLMHGDSLGFHALKSQQEVAKELGIARQCVTTAERRALIKIRSWYRNQMAQSGRTTHGSAARPPRPRIGAMDRYAQQIIRWRRVIRRMILSNCCHDEARVIIYAVAECEARLHRARAELGQSVNQ